MTGTDVQPKVQVEGVSKRFDLAGGGSLLAIEDITFGVQPGRFASLIGASGSGKTTLLRIIAGLATASAGTVHVDGNRVVNPGRACGFVFQQDSLWPWRTTFENVAYGPQAHGVSRAAYRPRVEALIKLVGLSGFEDRYPHQLSGGMRQRANLARALAIDPGVLLMDEPFAALDAQTRQVMQTELLSIWGHDRKTVLFVTHQIEEAVYLSDEVLVLSARPGRLIETVQIDLPRPRQTDVRHTPAFGDYVQYLWSRIEREVVEASRH